MHFICVDLNCLFLSCLFRMMQSKRSLPECSPSILAPGLIHKHWTRLKRLFIYKHSSLFVHNISDKEKGFQLYKRRLFRFSKKNFQSVATAKWQSTQLLTVRSRVRIQPARGLYYKTLYGRNLRIFVIARVLSPASFSNKVICLRVRPESTRVKHLSGGPLQGGLLASTTNIRLGWKGLSGTNTNL